MKLVIGPKENYEKMFAYNYLPVYMYNILNSGIDYRHISRLNKSYNFDAEKVIKFALANLRVTEDQNNYTISINKNLKLDNLFVDQLINMISYGNLTTKGYPIVNKIFNFTREHLPEIYSNWEGGR